MEITFSAAYQALTQAQKPARGVSIYSRYVNRPLGKLLAALSATVSLSPNAVTLISATLTAGAAVLIAMARPSVLIGVVVAALLVLGFAFDAADGQLARLLHRSSPAGEWFDHVVDAGKAVSLNGAILIAAYRHFDVPLVWLLVPVAYQVVGVVVQAGGTLRELLARVSRAASIRPEGGSVRRWTPIVLLAADSGVFGLAFLTWGWPDLFVIVYTLLFIANCLVGGALMIKWARELSSISPA